MAIRIVHFGADECRHTQVLTQQGYYVLKCDSIARLHSTLTASAEIDAVTVEESDGKLLYGALSLIRAHSSARLILFKRIDTTEMPVGITFDLIISGLTPPEEWIHKISALLAKSFAQ